ncbi:MAG: FAD-dependent oxidoreductase [Kiritimatiellae bacterium]|nr:FAD-dependent oxidoreductase [Kiritimatiellia bacterium]
MNTQNEHPSKPKLVILGTGFATFSMLHYLHLKEFEVCIVSPRNHFLFSPLLPSTTVGTLEFRSIIEPIRALQERAPLKFYQATCTGIDFDTHLVTCEGSFDGETFLLNYNYLVIAVGAVNKTFGIPGVLEHAHFLKELADARAIRQRIIENFERASTPLIPEEERKRLLHFVVVGGGPTGVEFAAELHDFMEEDLQDAFPDLMPEARITIVEASKTLLNTFDQELSEYTMKRFARAKIKVRTGTLVKEVLPHGVRLADGTELSSGIVVWSTGIGPTPLLQSLKSVAKDRGGRLVTDEFFAVDPARRVFAIGDCSTRSGDELPATAQVAQQEGEYLGKHLNRIVRGKTPKNFHYRHMGMLAYVGDRRALADTKRVKGHGFTTWIFWRSVYLTKLVSMKNKILVLFDWFKTALFGRDISRF